MSVLHHHLMPEVDVKMKGGFKVVYQPDHPYFYSIAINSCERCDCELQYNVFHIMQVKCKTI